MMIHLAIPSFLSEQHQLSSSTSDTQPMSYSAFTNLWPSATETFLTFHLILNDFRVSNESLYLLVIYITTIQKITSIENSVCF